MRKVVASMRVVKVMFFMFCAAFAMWLVASFIDINMHNDPFAEDYKEYQEWNAFLTMFGGDE